MRMWEALTGAQVMELRQRLKLSRDAMMERCEFPGARSAARLSNIEKKESWKPGDRERVVGAFRTLFWERGLPQPDIIGDDEYTGPPPETTQSTSTDPPASQACAHSHGFSRAEDGRWLCADCHEETPRAREAREALLAVQGPAAADVAASAEASQRGPETVPEGVSDVSEAERRAAATIIQTAIHHRARRESTEEEDAVLSGDQDWTRAVWTDPSTLERALLATQLATGTRDYLAGDVPVRPVHDVGAQVEVAGTVFTKVADDPFPKAGEVVVDATPHELESLWEDLLEVLVTDVSEVRQPDYTFTNSELRTWKRCRRKWWFEYHRKLGTRALDYTSARATGDRVHRALQAGYAGTGEHVDPRDALERAIVEDWTIITEVVTDPTELAVVAERFAAANALERAMVEGYVEWLSESGSDADYTVVGSEQVLSALFELEVDGRTYLAELIGKLDARLKRKTDGALLFVDHKTVGNFTDVVPTLKQNEQMLTYVLLEAINAAEDERVSGALYNMLRRVKRTGTAKPPFFERLEVHHNVHEIESFRAHLRGAATDILRTRAALEAGESHHLVAYPTPTNDCRWDCPFFKVCSMHDDGSPGVEDMLTTVYQQVDPLARYDGITPERSTVDHREIVK